MNNEPVKFDFGRIYQVSKYLRELQSKSRLNRVAVVPVQTKFLLDGQSGPYILDRRQHFDKPTE